MSHRQSSPSDAEITAAHVRDLAHHAALPLPPEREAAVAAILNAWVPDANALSRKMSAEAHLTLVPATVFSHPAVGEGEV